MCDSAHVLVPVPCPRSGVDVHHGACGAWRLGPSTDVYFAARIFCYCYVADVYFASSMYYMYHLSDHIFIKS